MYQQAEAGGDFDYCPGLRDEHDENYPGVQKVLLGDPGGVVRLPSSPGTLAVFRGQHALHRVTPVSGPRPRINSVLTYGERPGHEAEPPHPGALLRPHRLSTKNRGRM